MSDRAALLAAICSHPDEDTPRLVFADWLDEHGEGKRAAYIRAQIEHHRITTADTATSALLDFIVRQYENGFDRINWSVVDAELGAQVAAQKAADKVRFKMTTKSEGVPRVKGVTYHCYDRGFYDTVYLDSTSAFLKHAKAIYRAAPITSVTFNELTGEQAAEFVACGYLARTRKLCFNYGVEAEAVRVLGTHKDALGVRKLDFSMDEAPGSAIDALAAGKYWSGLESLEAIDLGEDYDNDDDGVSPGHISDLFKRPQFRNLRELIAWSSGADDDTAKVIAANMPELRLLDLAITSITERGANAIAASKKLRNLRLLDLSSCELEGADAGALINAPNLPNLTILRLDGNYLGGPNPKTLAKPGRGPGLRVLDLGSSHLSAAGVEALAKCPASRGVWHLTLENADISDSHLERFLRHANFEHLAYLELSMNDLTATGAKALAAWPGAAQLQWLDLSSNSIGESGAKALVASPHLKNLKHLQASGRGVALLKKHFKKVFR
jgi:uncharacterized protein (TIGR02996 family)